MNYKAYLVVICNKKTNAIEEVTIWSSPEWEQSRQLPVPTYIAYAVGGKDYADARKRLLDIISDPVICRRYYWLYMKLSERDKE